MWRNLTISRGPLERSQRIVRRLSAYPARRGLRGFVSACSTALLALLLAATIHAQPSGGGAPAPVPEVNVNSTPIGNGIPILVYHRFGTAVTDSMTITIATFESQLRYMREHGYQVVPLQTVVDYLMGKGGGLPPHPVVITADDGHISVYTQMFPIVKREHLPVTLFIYPSAISNASYAMTWPQLAELKATGLFTIQSHTYWHPNFKIEKRRLSGPEYQSLVRMQMVKSKATLEKKLGVSVEMLAWPFGIYDDELIAQARAAGYVAAFTIERRKATRRDNPLAIPRYLITNGDTGKAFAMLLAEKARTTRGADQELMP